MWSRIWPLQSLSESLYISIRYAPKGPWVSWLVLLGDVRSSGSLGLMGGLFLVIEACLWRRLSDPDLFPLPFCASLPWGTAPHSLCGAVPYHRPRNNRTNQSWTEIPTTERQNGPFLPINWLPQIVVVVTDALSTVFTVNLWRSNTHAYTILVFIDSRRCVEPTA